MVYLASNLNKIVQGKTNNVICLDKKWHNCAVMHEGKTSADLVNHKKNGCDLMQV